MRVRLGAPARAKGAGMSNVATRDDVRSAVRVLTIRFAAATVLMVLATGALILAY